MITIYYNDCSPTKFNRLVILLFKTKITSLNIQLRQNGGSVFTRNERMPDGSHMWTHLRRVDYCQLTAWSKTQMRGLGLCSSSINLYIFMFTLFEFYIGRTEGGICGICYWGNIVTNKIRDKFDKVRWS